MSEFVEREKQEGKVSTVWITGSYPVVALGLAEALKTKANVHLGTEPPGGEASLLVVLYCTSGDEDLASGVRRVQSIAPEAPVTVFGLHGDVSIARTALQAGARGFVHAGMQPSQIARAILVVSEGKIAVPRELIGDLIVGEEPVDADALSPRQREILELVCEGMTNAQIAKRLYLSEFTIKQHLRAAYKLLGVKNRTEAARVIRG